MLIILQKCNDVDIMFDIYMSLFNKHFHQKQLPLQIVKKTFEKKECQKNLRSLIIADDIRSLKSIMVIAAMCIILASLCICTYWAESYSVRNSEDRFSPD